jgi:ATP-dependent HslUV protease ATP-binding subunit HslU
MNDTSNNGALAESLTPKEIVEALDKYIIGQSKAKKAVAIALRNRARRRALEGDIKDEIMPKNIIMIGSTGVGKTEIARRLSNLAKAPFIKVEATKYTEVGYVGRDVESMIRDLAAVSINLVKKEMRSEVEERAKENVEDLILDLLLPQPKKRGPLSFDNKEEVQEESSTRQKFRKMLQAGELEDKEVSIKINATQAPMIEIFSNAGLEDMDMQFQNLMGNIMPPKKKDKKTTVKDARNILIEEEIDKLIDMDKVTFEALRRVEEMGIVFLDEIDKVAGKDGKGQGPDVSREGVQRDILPIVEGSVVNTKYGPVKTDHILFIAAGAFHMSKPSDLIPELQGRFPIRVELDGLSKDDLFSILTEPKNALVKQYIALMKTEGVELIFEEDALKEISDMAFLVNSTTENIGARRLHTIMERLLEEVSFSAPEINGQTVTVTKDYVKNKLKDIIEDRDLSRYIL